MTGGKVSAMWVEDQAGSLINLNYVTAIEGTVMETSYGQQRVKWAIVAHRVHPSHDVILLSHLDEQKAHLVVRRIREFLNAQGVFLDVRSLADESVLVDLSSSAGQSGPPTTPN